MIFSSFIFCRERRSNLSTPSIVMAKARAITATRRLTTYFRVNYCETKIENNGDVRKEGKRVGTRSWPLLKIVLQNEKRAKKKGAARSLIFLFAKFRISRNLGLVLTELICSQIVNTQN